MLQCRSALNLARLLAEANKEGCFYVYHMLSVLELWRVQALLLLRFPLADCALHYSQ